MCPSRGMSQKGHGNNFCFYASLNVTYRGHVTSLLTSLDSKKTKTNKQKKKTSVNVILAILLEQDFRRMTTSVLHTLEENTCRLQLYFVTFC